MFERYSISASSDKLADEFGIEVHAGYNPRYNAAPTQLLPVITSGAGSKGLSWFYWGRSPEFAHNRNLSEKIINLAAETLLDRPVLKKMLMRHRCCIPADGFYGWKRVGKKTTIPYRLVLTDLDLFSFAGVWEEFENQKGEIEHTFSIITVPANPPVSSILERMPVILSRDAHACWLDAGSSEQQLMDVLKAYPEKSITYYTVSPRIHDTNLDVPSLMQPAPPADQHGNLTLFD